MTFSIYKKTVAVIFGLFMFVFSQLAFSNDYLYKDKCPEGGDMGLGERWIASYTDAKGVFHDLNFWADKWGFAQCNCTSYVVFRLVQEWNVSNSLKDIYSAANWGDAKNWKSTAIKAGIGVTDARAEFVWNASPNWNGNVPPYNGAFPGDVAWWNQNSHGAGNYGHVARVESSEPDSYGKGVKCVNISEYNYEHDYDYGIRPLCKDNDKFPDAFIHITQDYAYCLQNPSDCPRFIAELNRNKQLANTDAGGFGSSDSSESYPITGGTNSGTLSDLIANSSIVENASRSQVTSLHINESANCGMQIKNVGNANADGFQTRCYISDGAKIDKNPRDEGKEDSTRGLSVGDTNTEHEDFIAPEFPGSYNMVFCVDSANQVKELNEGNNCHVENPFTVWSSPNLLVSSVNVSGGKTTLSPGEQFSVDTVITNAGENIGQTLLIGYYMDGVLIDTDRIQRENLKGSVSKSENLSIATAPTTMGAHQLQVCADFDNRITETNESDNCTSLNITVGTATTEMNPDQIEVAKKIIPIITDLLLTDPQLTVVVQGNGRVISNIPTPKAINCPSDCTETLSNPAITLVAKPKVGSVFKGWLGGCETTAKRPVCKLSVTDDKTITATFAKKK